VPAGFLFIKLFWRRGRDSNPRYDCSHTRFPSVLLQPLGHLSSTPYSTRFLYSCLFYGHTPPANACFTSVYISIIGRMAKNTKTPPVIKLKGLTKSYGINDAARTAIDNINLTIEKGEFVAIMGPSGCGKTTLLNILGLLDRPDEGEYLLD